MSENKQESPKSKVYLNYIEGSRLRKYEFNLNNPNEIRQYNQALKLDEDKRNTYLLLLAKKKLNSPKDSLTNPENEHTIYHPNTLVDKRYDLSHHRYIQEEDKEELKKIKSEKTKLEKRREKATEEEKIEIDKKMDELDKREKVIEKNLEEEYDKDYETHSSPQTSTKTTSPDSKTTKEIYKLLKNLDEKYGSKLVEIAEHFKNNTNTEDLINAMKTEMTTFKNEMAENEKVLIADTINAIAELNKAKTLTTLFNTKLKSSPAEIKKLAKKKYDQLSPANKRIFVDALMESPTKEDQIIEALEKTSSGNFAAVYELLSANLLTKDIAILFRRYWNQIGTSKLIPEIIKNFTSSKTKELQPTWENFIDTKKGGKNIATDIPGINSKYQYLKEVSRMVIYDGFVGTTKEPFAKMTTKLNVILEAFNNIVNMYNKAYGEEVDFDFKLGGEVTYPKDTSSYQGIKKFKPWDELVKKHALEVKIDTSAKNMHFIIKLDCNYKGALAIFMNGITLNSKGLSFTPIISPIKIFGQKIDVDEPLTELEQKLIIKPEEKEEEEEIDIEDLEPVEGEENPSEMENADGLGAIYENDTVSAELIKSELQTIKSLLFTIIYKMNKKDRDKYNKKNNNKSGNLEKSYDWLFD